jgi:hypothetical protein
VKFDEADPFAAEIARKYREGFLNAVSISWQVLKMAADGVTCEEWDMWDLSAVPIPGDPQALIERELIALRALTGDVRQASPTVDLPDDDEDDEDEGDGDLVPLLILARGAIPTHTPPVAVEDAKWDGPAEVAACAAEEEPLRKMHAWVNSDMPPVLKAAYRFPHHQAEDGRVVWRGVAAAMGRLSAGASIPEGDRDGVWRHLARHYKQFDKEAPELRSVDQIACLTPAEVEGQFKYGEMAHLREAVMGVLVDLLHQTQEQMAALAELVTVQDTSPGGDSDEDALRQLAEALKVGGN